MKREPQEPVYGIIKYGKLLISTISMTKKACIRKYGRRRYNKGGAVVKRIGIYLLQIEENGEVTGHGRIG